MNLFFDLPLELQWYIEKLNYKEDLHKRFKDAQKHLEKNFIRYKFNDTKFLTNNNRIIVKRADIVYHLKYKYDKTNNIYNNNLIKWEYRYQNKKCFVCISLYDKEELHDELLSRF